MAFCINKVSCRMLRFTLLFVLMLFQTHLALYLPRLGKSKLVYMLPMHLFLHLACVTFCLIYSSWCQGLAVTCDCGAPWTLLLFFGTHGMYLVQSLGHDNGFDFGFQNSYMPKFLLSLLASDVEENVVCVQYGFAPSACFFSLHWLSVYVYNILC